MKRIIQVPMEPELLASLGALAARLGVPRAHLIREACQTYLREQQEAEDDRAYVESYRQVPEDPAIGRAYAKMAARVLEKEKW